ncbi:hypothetical protein [Amycolatopsis sp. NPDC003676]
MDVNDVPAEEFEKKSLDPAGEAIDQNVPPKTASGSDDFLLVDRGMEELDAMRSSYEVLSVLEKEARKRAISWLIDSLGVSGVVVEGSENATARGVDALEVAAVDENPRDFISRKKPQSQAERVACLAYYLGRRRNQPHFKTADIAAMNIEAAGQKFGNLSRDMDNADRTSGYLVSAGQGAKQLTARGEAMVEALPDREAVKAALQEHRYRVKRTSGGSRKSLPTDGSDE